MPEFEKAVNKTNDNSKKQTYRNQISNLSPEEFLDNLRRVENIVSEVTRMLRR